MDAVSATIALLGVGQQLEQTAIIPRSILAVTYRLLLAAAFAGILLPSTALAQSDDQRAFASVYFGAQTGDEELQSDFRFNIYEETATGTVSQTYSGGKLFAIGGGVKVAGQVFVGAQFTTAGSDADTNVTASIPHPIVFNRPRSASRSADDLTHKERAFHVLVGYIIPVHERFDVSVSGGPTFFSLTHELVSGVQFSEGGPPFNTVTLTGLTSAEEQESATGFNLGAEATVKVTPNFGVGGFGRFARATVDLPAAGGNTISVDVGGLQLGVGVRVSF